jgi:hypothetical protein
MDKVRKPNISVCNIQLFRQNVKRNKRHSPLVYCVAIRLVLFSFDLATKTLELFFFADKALRPVPIYNS